MCGRFCLLNLLLSGKASLNVWEIVCACGGRKLMVNLNKKQTSENMSNHDKAPVQTKHISSFIFFLLFPFRCHFALQIVVRCFTEKIHLMRKGKARDSKWLRTETVRAKKDRSRLIVNNNWQTRNFNLSHAPCEMKKKMIVQLKI